MVRLHSHSGWLTLGLCLVACAPDTSTQSVSTPAINSAGSLPTPASAGRGAPTSTPPATVTTAPSASPPVNTVPRTTQAAPASAPPIATAGPAGAPAAPPAQNHEGTHAAGAAAPAPAAGPGAAVPPAPGGGGGAEAFCAKYEMHCHYGQANRHADKAACIADFNGNPVQQGCKNMHIDTAIAGTAAACNGMASEFCFAIHCLHAAGITDPTGVTYCK